MNCFEEAITVAVEARRGRKSNYIFGLISLWFSAKKERFNFLQKVTGQTSIRDFGLKNHNPIQLMRSAKIIKSVSWMIIPEPTCIAGDANHLSIIKVPCFGGKLDSLNWSTHELYLAIPWASSLTSSTLKFVAEWMTVVASTSNTKIWCRVS